MRTLVWTLVWVALLLAGAGHLWAAVRRSWRSLRALGAEVEMAERRLAQAQARTHAAAGPTHDPAVGSTAGSTAGSVVGARAELALFRDRASLRAEREARRRSLRERRRSQRERSRPAWARRVDS